MAAVTLHLTSVYANIMQRLLSRLRVSFDGYPITWFSAAPQC